VYSDTIICRADKRRTKHYGVSVTTVNIRTESKNRNKEVLGKTRKEVPKIIEHLWQMEDKWARGHWWQASRWEGQLKHTSSTSQCLSAHHKPTATGLGLCSAMARPDTVDKADILFKLSNESQAIWNTSGCMLQLQRAVHQAVCLELQRAVHQVVCLELQRAVHLTTSFTPNVEQTRYADFYVFCSVFM
jgi:hypothetical protein